MVEENSVVEGYRFVGTGRVAMNEYDGVGLMYRMDKGWDVYEDVEGSARSKQKNLNGRIITYNISKGKDHIAQTIVYMKIEGGTDFRRINVSILEELSCIEAKYQNDCWLLMGDFNAHIGLLGEEVNVNGRLVREWIVDGGLILKNLEVPGIETG
jgi:exonuclease III